jgi:predicted nuclease of predicted toxin-antitoxin system
MTMRWLCDENIPRILVEELRQRGHDAAWIREIAPGLSDTAVLALAVRDHRICLTFDKNFGELSGSASVPADCGVVLLRMPFRPTPGAAAQLAAILEARIDWPGHFSVIEPGRIRMRSMHERSRRDA